MKKKKNWHEHGQIQLLIPSVYLEKDTSVKSAAFDCD